MLRKLFLIGGNINDEGCRVIADSLRINRRLRRLCIFNLRTIGQGFASFIPVVCDASDIESTLNSNHRLESVTVDRDSRVPAELSELLDMNKGTDTRVTAKLKVLRCHFNDGFDLTAVAGLDAKELPFLLEWFGRLHDIVTSRADLEDERICRSAFYRIIRHNPELCGYPSYERVARLKAEEQVANLEHELDDEKSRNEKLQREVKALERQLEELMRNKRQKK